MALEILRNPYLTDIRTYLTCLTLSCRDRGARAEQRTTLVPQLPGRAMNQFCERKPQPPKANRGKLPLLSPCALPPYLTPRAPFRTKKTEIPTFVASATQPSVRASFIALSVVGLDPKQPANRRLTGLTLVHLFLLRLHSISVHHVFGFGASWPSSSRLSGASPGAEWLVSEPLVTGDNGRHSSTKWLEYVVQFYE